MLIIGLLVAAAFAFASAAFTVRGRRLKRELVRPSGSV
jgi:hypothetical protein